MLANKWTRGFLILLALLFLSAWALEMDAWARAGGGGSSGGGGRSSSGSSSGSIGSRGSRTGQAPTPYTAPSPTRPSQPSPGLGTPPPASQPGSFMRSFGGGLLGGLAGGMLFHSLFGGSAYGGGMGGMGGSGISLIDILLLVGIGYLAYRFFFKKTAATTMSSSQGAMGIPAYQASTYPAAYDQPQAQGAGVRDLEQGLANIRQYDPAFEEAKFQDMAMDLFFQTQGAWANRDMAPVRQLFTAEMFQILQGDVDQMKVEKKINRLENIAVRSVDITEAWQESGADYITVRIYANLLDYHVDETTGQVVEGSKTAPVKFEEYWTFTRPVGPNPWQLSAIQQAPA